MKTILLFLTVVSVLFTSCGKKEDKTVSDKKSDNKTDSTVLKTAEDAFLYCYSLIIMDITKRKLTNTETATSAVSRITNSKMWSDLMQTHIIHQHSANLQKNRSYYHCPVQMTDII